MAEALKPHLENRPRLAMCGIQKSFGATLALKDVDFEVGAGEVHALVGENGAGKSTLMKILAGSYSADGGTMELEGNPFRPRNPSQARKMGVGMIYQELSLVPDLSVAENMFLGMEPHRWGWIQGRKMGERVQEILSQLEHPEILPETLVSTLSSSAQQLVEIGRSLAMGCRVLILDEPTSSLTQHDVERLFSMIQGLKDQGMAIIYISHFLEEVQMVADRLTILRDGAVVKHGPADSLSHEEIVEKMVGREVQELYPRHYREPEGKVLEIQGIPRLEGPGTRNLSLRRGEVLGIFGLVGAGRTRLLRAVFGLEPKARGKLSIILLGKKTRRVSNPRNAWKGGVGFLSEDRQGEGLAPDLNIQDNLTLSHLRKYGIFGFLFPKKQRKATQDWIASLDIKCRGPAQSIRDLSGGNQQKVSLARLLDRDVDVLLLDEPTRGVDVGAKAKIYEVINQAATGSSQKRKLPKAVLMVSSYIPELLGVCDRIAVMCRGRLGEARPTSELDEHDLMWSAIGNEPY